MHLLRTTWLNQSRKGKWMHYFVFCDKDPDKFEMDDVIIVECEHGYDHLLSKMIAAYKELLKRYPGVSYFLRADVDNKIAVDIILEYIPLLERGIERKYEYSTCQGPHLRVIMAMPQIQCHTECSQEHRCTWYEWSSTAGGQGRCILYQECESIVPGEHTLTRYFRLSDPIGNLVPGRTKKPFIFGTIMYNNTVQIGESTNQHWNDPHFVADLGLHVYPTYPEASGYLFSAIIAKILVSLGPHVKQWAVEDASMGAILAGLDIDFYQMPIEVIRHTRVLNVLTEEECANMGGC
eukprot:GEMP01033585.1.p2 GENE.GEMP01033585.1~~GEMP01033585.1.p2  ORF type:complete len:293 (+),score=46.60 GEMP01033585.1:886-1764(+)